jgi:hypothetical protein
LDHAAVRQGAFKPSLNGLFLFDGEGMFFKNRHSLGGSMGFLDSIVDDWNGKSATPEYRARLEKAMNNWVTQKSASVNASLAKGEIGVDEAASQISHLHMIGLSKVGYVLSRRPKDAALKAASYGRSLVDKPDETQ